MTTRSSGYFLQSTFGTVGNFELVVPSTRGGFVHTWRDNDSADFSWIAPDFLAAGYADGVSLIQRFNGTETPGDLEVVFRVGDRLAHIVRRDAKWREPTYFASGVSGRPALIQSRFGVNGNYEVVVPLLTGGLALYSRNNDDPTQSWGEPGIFAKSLGQVDSVALVQSNFGEPGNLEIVARSSNSLSHFWRDSGPAFSWQGPNPVPLAGLPEPAVPIGIHGFVQSRYGSMGNFELVVPLSTGRMAHLSRNNDDPNPSWGAVTVFGPDEPTEASIIHGSFGNLELIVRVGDRFEHYFRDAQSGAWAGPTMVAYEDPRIDTSSLGEWRVPYSSAVVGIHAAQLNTSQLLLFTYEAEEDVGPGNSCVVDPQSGVSTLLPTVQRDPFCAGQSFLPDGQLLIAGGSGLGLRSLHTFTPERASGSWEELADMVEGRWYPTCTALPDGRVFILSGTKEGGPQPAATLNGTYEIYSPQEGLSAPVQAPFLDEVAPVSTYPFVFVLPLRKLFIHAWNKTCFLDLDTWTFEDRRVLTVRPEPRNYPVQGTAVLLPLLPTTDPPYRARVMLIGGGGVPPSQTMPATETCEILDLGEEPLTWRAAPPLSGPRVMGDAVLLPNGTVLVVNGSRTGWADDANQPVYDAQLYNPVDNTWTTMSSMRVPRLYHATAILLPDGRVLTAGTDETYNIEPFKKSELRLEVFSPPYLFRGQRPTIASGPSAVPAGIAYGSVFVIQTPDASSIASVALLRPGAVTHSFNMEQRYVALVVQDRNSQSLSLLAPPDGYVAPPGYYMLFLINSAGVPSVGQFIHLS